MRHLLPLALLVTITLTAAADDPPRYHVRTTSPGVHRLDLKTLAVGLPCDMGKVRLTHAGTTLPVWHVGEDPARATRASVLYFVAPEHVGEHTRDPGLVLTLGAPGKTYAPAALTTSKASEPADTVPVTALLERNRIRVGLERALFPITKGPERWYWAKVPAKGKAQITLPLGLPPAAGAGQLGVRARADRAAGESVLQVYLGPRLIGRLAWEGRDAGQASWAVPDATELATRGLTLHNPGDRDVYLDRVACVYTGKLEAGPTGQVTIALKAASGPLRVSGIGGPAIVLVPGRGAGQTEAAPDGGALTLAASGPGTLIVAELGKVPAATAHRLPTQSLTATDQQADYLMICPPALRAAIAPLAAHRRKEGLVVRLVDPAEIYDAFGEGRFGPGAVRAFLAHATQKWRKPAPQYCLLVGDATGGVDWARPGAPIVPTGTVETYLNGESASDNWLADADGDHLPEISMGRLPANTPAELTTMVGKILRYETQPYPETWRRRISFITGPGRFNPLADQFIESLFAQLITTRIPDFYRVDVTYANPTSPYCPAPRAMGRAVLDRVNQGSLFLCYVGHGFRFGFDSLRSGRKRYPIMTVKDLPRVAIEHGMPIVTVVACSTAHFDGTEKAERDSIGEGLIRHPRGPVAFIGSTRISHPYANGLLGKEMLDVLFGAKRSTRIGPALDRAKARILKAPPKDPVRRMIDGAARLFVREGPPLARIRQEHAHLYLLLGDPAMRIRVPDSGLELTAPDAARLGTDVVVSGTSRLKGGTVRVELLISRDKLLVPLETVDPAAADRDAVMARNYKKANHKLAGAWTTKVAEDGTFHLTLKAEAGLPAGTYRIVAFATDGAAHQIGARRITLAREGGVVAFTSIQKIRFDDVDGAGIVYYPQYFHLCHATFEDFFDTASPWSYPSMISDRRRGFPTVSITSSFDAPLTYGDTAIVKLAIARLGRSSVAFAYEIRRKSDGVLCFTAEVTTVHVDLDSMKPVPIEGQMRDILTQFLSGTD